MVLTNVKGARGCCSACCLAADCNITSTCELWSRVLIWTEDKFNWRCMIFLHTKIFAGVYCGMIRAKFFCCIPRSCFCLFCIQKRLKRVRRGYSWCTNFVFAWYFGTAPTGWGWFVEKINDTCNKLWLKYIVTNDNWFLCI